MSNVFEITINTEDYSCDLVSSEVIEEILLHPENLHLFAFDCINILCGPRKGIKAGDPRWKTGVVELFLDLKGSCIIRYNGMNTSGSYTTIADGKNLDEMIEFPDRYGGIYVFKKKNWIPVEEGLRYIKEFCENGEIKIDGTRWESV